MRLHQLSYTRHVTPTATRLSHLGFRLVAAEEEAVKKDWMKRRGAAVSLPLLT